MSKYSVLKGLSKLLPSGEKALIDEGDDIIRALQGLDERMIESGVSQRDATNRAHNIKKQLGKDLYPRDKMDYEERKHLMKELSDKLYPNRFDSPRTVGHYHFPEEFDRYVDPEEIAQLSKQYRDNERDAREAISKKLSILRDLEKTNPLFKREQIEDDYRPSYDEVSKRFKNIRSALKAMEGKKN